MAFKLTEKGIILIVSSMLAVAFAGGCSEGIFTGEMSDNQRPVVELTNGPIEGDSVQYNVHFYWLGDDPDGTIDHYEFVLVEGKPFGFNPVDTIGSDKWTRTILTDSTFVTTADEYDKTVTINQSMYAIYDKAHTFFIRAVDNRGAVSEVAYRSFTAWTLAPHIFITDPYYANPDGGIQILSPIVNFKWYGKDPVDAPWNYQDVDSTRWMWTNYRSTIIQDLNANPGNYEQLWSNWRWIDAPGDSGRSTILGDDEMIPPGRSYVFVVQAKDDAGAVSAVFDVRSNVRCFMIRTPTGPMLNVREAFLGDFSFIGVNLFAESINIPPGFEINFTWTADASHYGAIVSTYRYGWDISDLDDPTQWETMPSPYVKASIPKKFYSGVHTLYIEATDNLGVRTLGIIEVSVIPVVMQRDLLWVDDHPSSNFPQVQYAWPREDEQDEFWYNICMRAATFNPTRDIFDVSEHDFLPPPMEHLWKYKNIIWLYSSAIDPIAGSAWTRLIYYTPEQYFSYSSRNFNYLPYYLAFGGHIWSIGQGERGGGLAAQNTARKYPNYIKCEWYITGTSCHDTLGTGSMAWRDYCVAVLDKIEGVFKTYIPFNRDRDLDAMRWGFIDETDPFTTTQTGLPRRLDLWEQVTEPGMFFDPQVRGFNYVEIYNPHYWMAYNGIHAQSCFHPMYRMRAMVSRSVLDGQTIAFWTTKYAHVVPPVEGCVPAPSVHFGFPLWFFNRAQADSIADVIFNVWQIK